MVYNPSNWEKIAPLSSCYYRREKKVIFSPDDRIIYSASYGIINIYHVKNFSKVLTFKLSGSCSGLKLSNNFLYANHDSSYKMPIDYDLTIDKEY